MEIDVILRDLNSELENYQYIQRRPLQIEVVILINVFWYHSLKHITSKLPHKMGNNLYRNKNIL
jgi:hypothetical protein